MSTPDLAPYPAVPGDVIAGKYRIDGVLGTGGMGIVFAATHLHLERAVAVKVMRAELAEFPGAVQRLVLEAKLAGRLRSEHVCKVLDVGTLPDGAPYVVMEYLEGADLASLIAQQCAFATPTAVDFVLEACEALAEAHAAHIVHRDLKPENLFVARALDGTSTIKVLDFGISKQRGGPGTGASRNLTNPSAALGSPNYMPPEQMRSPKDVDGRADLWAIGAILYEMLTGQQAFSGGSVPEVCAAVMGTTPVSAHELRPDLPRRLVQLLERCLQKNPADRFQDVSELATALAPFGSAKAQTSLTRIERVLAGANAATLVTPSLAPRNTPVGSRPTPPLRYATPTAEITTATLTTGAAVALLGSSPRRRRSLWVLGAVLALGTVGAWVLAERAKSAPPAAKPAPRAAATPSAPVVTPAREAGPSINSAASAAVGASIPLPSPVADREKAKPAGVHRVVHARTTAASAAPPATVAARPAAAVTGAWDPASFGPRR